MAFLEKKVLNLSILSYGLDVPILLNYLLKYFLGNNDV